MSRSKRIERDSTAFAPMKTGSLWTSENGRVRTGWLTAVSLLGFALTSVVLRRGLQTGFAVLFDSWNINSDNAWRAPAWAATLFRWQGALTDITISCALLFLCRWLRRLWRFSGQQPRPARGFLRAALTGFGAVLIIAALCLIPDSMRLDWPIAAPRLTSDFPVLCVVALVVTLAEEAFSKRVLYSGLRERRGRTVAAAAVCILFFLSNGGFAGSMVSGINVVLLGWACCLIYEHYGLWAVTGFRWGWSVANTFLLGFGGGRSSVYRLYGVSENLLTGGDAGPMYGVWTTMLLAGLIGWAMREPLRRAMRRLKRVHADRRKAQ